MIIAPFICNSLVSHANFGFHVSCYIQIIRERAQGWRISVGVRLCWLQEPPTSPDCAKGWRKFLEGSVGRVCSGSDMGPILFISLNVQLICGGFRLVVNSSLQT